MNILPAPLWRRLIASVYDGLLLLGLWMAALLLELIVRQQLLGLAGHHVWLSLYLFGVGLWFFAWFWIRGGQTLGMRVWRLQVRRLDGAPLRLPIATLRYAAMLATWLALLAPTFLLIPRFPVPAATQALFVLCGLIALGSGVPMLGRGRRRALCDWVAGTEVVLLPPRK